MNKTMKNIYKQIASLISGTVLLATLLYTVAPVLAATYQTPDVRALFETSLASKMTSSATSFTLTSGTDFDGNALTTSTYGFIINEGESNEEMILADCTGTVCTNAVRGISSKTGTSTVASLQFPHPRGASVKITDAPSMLFLIGVFKGRQTIENALTYASTVGTSTASFPSSYSIVNRGYVDNLAFGGVPGASETAAGFVEIATGAEAAAGTSSGTSGRLVIPATAATSSCPSSGNYIPVTESGTGKLPGNCIPPTITSAVTFTGTTTMYRSQIAGETITGATLPVPVYASTTDSRYYATDGNDVTRYKFTGFAVSTATAGNAVNIQTSGIVTGFSGLTAGRAYYVQDAIGTIGLTPGTTEILVGVAVSATEILIQKGPLYLLGSVSFSDSGPDGAVQTSTVNAGFRPSRIRVTMVYNGGTSSANKLSMLNGVWVNGTYRSAYISDDNDTSPGDTGGVESAIVYRDVASGDDNWTLTVTSVTETGWTFSITQNETSPVPISMAWEAEGQY